MERMVTIMKRFYTAESVTEGHPDKLCDLIADSILDACLKEDECTNRREQLLLLLLAETS